MKNFRILIYEDNSEWVDGFIFNLNPKFQVQNIILKYLHRLDGATIMQDLEFIPDLILVDYDLGDFIGTEILDRLYGDPQGQNTSIFFYSGGESIQVLKGIAQKYTCGISCYNKDGSNLERAVLAKGQLIGI
jgi:CheY-like chemotaxis protein